MQPNTEEKEEMKEEMKLPSELLAPRLTISDILVSNTDDIVIDKNEIITNKNEHHYPSQIIDNWLYLGSSYEARDLYILKQLGITHILNVTNNVKNYFINDTEYKLKYAQLPLNDIGNDSIYVFFEATKQFINECDPLYNSNQNKIFIHCAVGMSRSASIVIAYLMSNCFQLKDTDQQRLQFIKNRLKTIQHDFNENMTEFMNSWPLCNKYSNAENELNDQQIEMLKKYRSQYNNNKGMKLNEAYYYVKSCRSIISPNTGFFFQLRRYEKLYNDGCSTLYDVEKFTKIENDVESIWKQAADKYPNKISVDNRHDRAVKFCVVL